MIIQIWFKIAILIFPSLSDNELTIKKKKMSLPQIVNANNITIDDDIDDTSRTINSARIMSMKDKMDAVARMENPLTDRLHKSNRLNRSFTTTQLQRNSGWNAVHNAKKAATKFKKRAGDSVAIKPFKYHFDMIAKLHLDTANGCRKL